MSTNFCLLQIGTMEVTVVRKPIRNLHLAVLPPDGKVRVSSPLKALAEKNDKVIAFQNAYPNEILPPGEVERNTAWNNYQSLQSGHLLTPPPFVGSNSDVSPETLPANDTAQQPNTPTAESVSPSATPVESVAPTDMPSPTPSPTDSVPAAS
jgi:hypothetical protein